jgi:hypothetical protein
MPMRSDAKDKSAKDSANLLMDMLGQGDDAKITLGGIY